MRVAGSLKLEIRYETTWSAWTRRTEGVGEERHDETQEAPNKNVRSMVAVICTRRVA